jgi:hypothetical protein
MEHVGAISAEEVASWRERLRDAAMWREHPHEPPGEDVTERAIAYLERLIAPLSPSTRETATACFSAVGAYEETGILTPEEALAWREQVRAQLDLEPERPPRCSRRDLRRVVPGPSERIHGLRITSVELYGDGVVLHWHESERWLSGPETPRLMEPYLLEAADRTPRALTDDLDTRYIGGGWPDLGINGGGWTVRLGSSPYTPAVPADARRLTVSVGIGLIDIEL